MNRRVSELVSLWRVWIQRQSLDPLKPADGFESLSRCVKVRGGDALRLQKWKQRTAPHRSERTRGTGTLPATRALYCETGPRILATERLDTP